MVDEPGTDGAEEQAPLNAQGELLALSRALRTELERRAHAGRRRHAPPGELPPLELPRETGAAVAAQAQPPEQESRPAPERESRPAPTAQPQPQPQPQPAAPPAAASDADEALPWADSGDDAGVLIPAAPRSRPDAQSSPEISARPAGPPTRQWAAEAADLSALAERVSGCRACGLCETRNKTVFADGAATAKVMFVGEAPGADEDRTGTPFVGAAGQLLSKIIAAGMGLDRGRDTYIANVLKCRPPGNRDPEPREKQACTPYLERQIQLVDPQVVIPLGRHAAQHLLGVDLSMGKLRGRVHRPTSGPCAGRVVVPTYHPSYLLRSPSQKRYAWEDIQLAMKELGLPLKG
ncbi:MAG: uracil-DNA glycosylase [Planctomycetota bacterium]